MYFLLFLCVCVCVRICACVHCVYRCIKSMLCSWRPEEGIRKPGIGNTGNYRQSFMAWGLNPGLLEEQPAALTVDLEF